MGASHGRGVLCTTVHPSIPSLEHLPATCQSSYYRNKCRRRRTSSLHALSVARIGDGPSRREMRKHVPLELLYNDPICCTVTHSRIGLSTAIRESHCSPVLEPRAERPHPLMRQCNERESTQELSLRTLPQAETSTGIDWDVAATGIRLWVTAKTQAEQGGDRIALRSMHIDALRY